MCIIVVPHWVHGGLYPNIALKHLDGAEPWHRSGMGVTEPRDFWGHFY